MRIHRLFIVVAIFVLSSCAKEDSDSKTNQADNGCPFANSVKGVRFLGPSDILSSPASSFSRVGNITLDKGLSIEEQSAFSQALQYLDVSQASDPDPQLLSYMHLNSFDGFSIRQWIEDRVQYIYPESFDLNSIVRLNENYTGYANPDVVPPMLQGCLASPIISAASQGKVVMSNIGAMIYLKGKLAHILYGVPTDGQNTIPMTSPRSGVLETGSGLFLISEQYQNVVKIFRLTTLIHESRHSDGNGLTTGFLHSVCPSGTYKGMAACDHSLNGPYEIEAMATKAFMNSCTSCSVKEMQILRELYLDTSSRRIDDADTSVWDDAPEGQRQ